MGKKKSWKQKTDQIAKQQLHGTISGSVKKNKNPKFKKTPIGKVALINNSKIQKKEVKSVSSEKNAQKSYVNAENKNQDLPKKAFKDSIKQSSSNGKQSLLSKAKNESLKGKYICNPEEMLEHIDSDSDSHISEETSQEDSSLNKMDESIEDEEEEDSDTDILDILGKSLKDESDEDDEDYENMEEEDNEDEDDEDKDDNDEGRFKYKGVKMFRGLRSDAKKDESDEENGKLVQTDMDLDNYESSSSDDFMGFLDSDEYEYSNEEDEHEDMYTDKSNDDYENQVQNNKNANKTDTSMEIDKDDKDEDDDDDDDDSEVDGDEDDNDDDDDDDDDDSADEETGLKALLGKSIADDDDDKDFNEEDEDDEDDDISSEDEDDEENNTVKQMKDFDDDDDDDDEDFNKDDEDCDSSEYDEYDEENNTVKQIKGKEKREEAANQKGIREFKFMNPDMKQRYEEELERKIVVVQNISKDATRDKMIELFRQYGGLKKMSLTPLTVIKTIKVATKTDDGTPNVSYGTLHELLSLVGRFLYATEKSAQDAVRALHGKMVDGHYLSVQTLAQFNGPYNPEKCVFITNLKKDVKLNDIWKAFLKYGDIVCIELMRNNETKACKSGYIQFYTKEAVASILNSRSTIKVKGRQVIVSKLKCEKEAMIMYREAKMKAKKDCSTTEENEREDFKRKPQQIINDKIAQKRANPKAVFVHSKENVKKQQGENEENKSTVFQGQKVHLKSKKKKKSKLDKKRKEMAKKLTAKSAKV